jgi:hypothetical protein
VLPPHFPDIVPLDFFLWGYVKDQVCAAVADVKRTSYSESGRRWDVCRPTDGSHCEVFHTEQFFHLCLKKAVSIDE